MAWKGGPQPGSGRKKGGRNAATLERQRLALIGIAAAEKGHVMPLDVLLAKMRGTTLPDGTAPSKEQFDAAIAAAPYLHPRLASTDTTIKSDNVHRVVAERPLSVEEWTAQHGAAANDAAAVGDADVG